MKPALLAALAAPDFSRRLLALAEDAPASAAISLSIDLGCREENWLAWLPAVDSYWYWAQPARRDFRLGLGCALRVSSAGPARFAALDNCFGGLAKQWRYERLPGAFIGFAFDEQAKGEMPNALLAVPSILLTSRGGRCHAIFTAVAGLADEAIANWQNLLAGAEPPYKPCPAKPIRHPLAERAWQARVEAALHDIAAGRLEKVVLTRSLRLAAKSPIAAPPLLAALLETQADSTVYAFGNRQQVFLGASPERLVSLRAGLAEADALAGTAWQAERGDPSASPLSGDKNRREQGLVFDAVQAALAPLCSRLETSAAPEVLQLRGLSHLRSRVAGRIRPGTSLFDLIRRLHPTPAVGGSPTAAALDWLRQHHEQRGAWYSGGIGHIDAEGNGEIAVALRCALIQANEAELYAGAGIVAGSQPKQELAETEAKLATLLDVFCESPDSVLERTGTL